MISFFNTPLHNDIFYGGQWHTPKAGIYDEVFSPADGQALGQVARAGFEDVELAVSSAYEGFLIWRDVPPIERARIMRRIANIFRENARELALIDATNGGNPISEMESDIHMAAGAWDFFAGLVTEMKGTTVPMGAQSVNYSAREPYGVVLRIAPFNHPFLFCGGRAAAPIAAGNSIIVKPPEQAPLSALRIADLLSDVLPPGVYNVLPGQRDTGAALVEHPRVAMIALTGSVQTGKAVMHGAAATLKPLKLELGGKNALIAFEDTDPDKIAAAVVRGMNFTWCGQSCGSTSRAFVHRSIYAQVLECIPAHVAKYVPGVPSRLETTMGAIISKTQHEKILGFIASGVSEGARIVWGGKVPDDPELAKGYFIEPTVFADVRQSMKIAREEIFGPVVCILPWEDEESMIREVNSVDYGLTCAIWTNRLDRAHRTAKRVEAGFIWINEVGKHFQGTPFGGYKQSGIGREECFEELISYTQEKHVHLNLAV